MPGPRVARSLELVERFRDILDGADLADVRVTNDALTVKGHALRGVVVVNPPDLKFPNYGTVDAEWEVLVIAGPSQNFLAAWDRIDEILAALTPDEPFVDAELTGFQPVEGSALPAYRLTYSD